MEKLFHYVWKHRLFPLQQLRTTDGRVVEIIDAGLHNQDAGPDFFNSKISINGQMWVGNVELHIKASQWYQHGHDHDEAYDNVVLHVVTISDQDVYNSRGERLPQLVLPLPDSLKENYDHLLTEDRYPRCFKAIPSLPSLMVHSWMSALQTERLERKTEDVMRHLNDCNGSWEDALFRTLARNYGFGVNSDAFEAWSKSFQLHQADHHRDDPFQIEALFLGQAGLLEPTTIAERNRDAAEKDSYFRRLRMEYSFLKNKFQLTPIDGKMWKFLRMRPQNFPYIRLSQLAMLYCSRSAGMSQLRDCKDIKELRKALSVGVSEYWETHYTFGNESEKNEKRLSKASIDVLLINTVIPLLFAYGRYHGKEEMVDKALQLLDSMKPEDNNIIRLWKECGLDVRTAGDTQALIQLKKEYCDKKECLRCRIGYQYMKVVHSS